MNKIRNAAALALPLAVAVAAPAFAQASVEVTEAVANMDAVATGVDGFATVIGGIIAAVIGGMVTLMSVKVGFRLLRKGTGG